jgi:hypothetical protein
MSGAAQKAPMNNNPIILDFNGLFDKTATNAPKTPVEPRTEKRNIIRPLEEKADTAAIQPANGLLIKAQEQTAEKQRTIDIYKEYQSNTIKSSQLQAEILKGLNAGEDITTLFLKAAQAISAMTNDSVFYNEIKERVTAIYGAGLQEDIPLSIELEQVEQRLMYLEEAALWNEGGELLRIQRAIEAHTERAQRLRELIKKGTGEAPDTLL